MLANNLRENVPDLWRLSLNHLLGRFNSTRKAAMLELTEDKRLEQFKRHFLGQTTLMQLQSRTGYNYRTTGVIHTLTEQVLTETTLLTFNHVSKGFQWALIRTRDRTTATAVI